MFASCAKTALRQTSLKRCISSVHGSEIEHFNALAPTWWDLGGPSALLHKMNPPRIQFIKDHIAPDTSHLWLKDKEVLDIGCGGGILAESLARLGASTVGLDASSEGISVARQHSKLNNLEIEYVTTTAEDFAKTSRTFDVITAMEIFEHVASPPAFLETLLSLLRPQGWLFLSTIEASRFARLLTCTIAEDLLRLVPRGTF